MPANRFYYLLLLSLLSLLGYLTYKIMSPFFTAIAWAVVFSIIFFPVYVFILKYLKVKVLAAVITTILILIVIIGPLTYLTFMLVDELRVFVTKMSEASPGSAEALIERVRSAPLIQKMSSSLGVEDILSEAVIMENLKKAGKGLIDDFSLQITNIISAAVNFIFMVFTTFFFLKDGPGFLMKAKDYMPFNELQKDRLAAQIKDTIVSTVFGGVVIAIIQGFLGGSAYYVLGIEAPVMWGFAMSIMSFVPLLGTFAIWGPTSAYMVIQGNYMQGAGLFLFGVLVISSVDNILKPLIIGSRTKMPTVIILFSVLGGIKLFGMIGLIMGPLITALFMSVFEIIRSIEGVADASSEDL